MTEKKRDQLLQRLNQLGKDWGELRPEGDESVRQALTEEIFCTICEMFSGDHAAMEAISVFFLGDWPKFDPKLSELGEFVKSRIKLRARDAYKRDTSGRYTSVEDPNTGETKRKYVSLRSLDVPAGEDDALTGLDTLAAGSETDPYTQLAFDDTACQLLLLMAELPQRLEGRANNPARRNYFRLFFTDGVATALQSGPVPDTFRKRENDLIHAVKLPFLDYFMIDLCRTADEIAASATRPFCQVVEGRGPERTPLPLPNDVYIAYLDRVEGYSAKAPAVTQQRQQYRQFIRDNLERS